MTKKYKVATNPKTGNDILLFIKKRTVTEDGDINLYMEFKEEVNVTLFGNDLQDYLQDVFQEMDCYDKCEKLEELDCRWSEVGEYWYDNMDKVETVECFENMLESQGKDYQSVEYASDFGEYYAVLDWEELEYGEILNMEKDCNIYNGTYMEMLALYTMTNSEYFTKEDFTNFGYEKIYNELLEQLEDNRR